MLEVEVDSLPESVDPYQAVEQAYRAPLRFAWERLLEGTSLLVRCDKEILPYLQRLLRRKLSQEGRNVVIVDGRDQPGDGGAPSPRIPNIVAHLRELVGHTDESSVFLLPYLDIITSASQGGLSMEAKEVMTVIHENPLLTLAAFEDPDFPIPELVASAFPARTEMLGVPRRALPALISRSQGRKFARDRLNLMVLHKYVSGQNAVSVGRILHTFEKKADYDPADPSMHSAYLTELRALTAAGDVDLSHVKLDRDIAGYAAVKGKIRENLLDLLERCLTLQDEKEVARIEAVLPRGLIFHGPPGTGKTLFAKGIAEAVNATVYTVSGPELKSKWVGQGEANVRRLFAMARETAPSVIIFDELDSVAARRSAEPHDGGAQAANSMVNQLLTEMDGFRKEQLVFVIGTTNFPEALDAAFLRPGRFELQVEIPYPEWEDRLEILSLYDRKLGTGLEASDLERLASYTSQGSQNGTPCSGDHLCAIIRDLARHRITKGGPPLHGEELMAWLRSRTETRKLLEGEDRIVAYHEVGHALMMCQQGRATDIKRITIESGMPGALGFVETVERKANLYTQSQLRGFAAIALGGYVAEKLVFEEVSTGASEDLFRATAIVEDMVASFGMGPLGAPRSYVDDTGRLNPLYHASLSPQIDTLLLEILAEVTKTLEGQRSQLDRVVERLIEVRTLEPEALRELLEAEA
ncbi:MAG: AAA family ATPase [Myxococcota bacterium]|nr:AAA family ATPase [Myxococcota bacterium]